MARADRVIAFIEKLKITIGDDAGRAFRLRDWQKAFIRDVYDNVDSKTLNRRTRRAILSIARKNGKTEIAAALILVHLIGPEAELNGEIYSAANDREQASIVFNAVRRMIEASPQLQRHLTVVPSTKTIFVKSQNVKGAGSKFRALSAEAGTKHGLNASFVVYDELAQSKSRELFDTLITSQGARKEPLFLTISTQNNDPNHPLTEMIEDALVAKDPAVICHLHAADDECDLMDRDQWVKANPALGDFRDEAELASMAARAVRLPSEEATFRLLYLNQRVSLETPFIAQADWKRIGAAASGRSAALIPGEAVYLGLDMSITTDLTALVVVSADSARVQPFFWKPAELVREHTKRDRAPYDVWVKQGHLLTSPGRVINPRLMAAKIVELCEQYDVRGLAFDRYKTDEMLRYMADLDFPCQKGPGDGLALHGWGQGFASMGPACNAFEEAVLTDELVHDDNPLLNFCVRNAITVSDPAGNRKLDKSKTRFRIDGAVALAMALGLRATVIEEPEPTNPWEDPEFTILIT